METSLASLLSLAESRRLFSTESKVVEVCVVLRVHQDRREEEDGEGQVEDAREEGEVRENRTSWMTCR